VTETANSSPIYRHPNALNPTPFVEGGQTHEVYSWIDPLGGRGRSFMRDGISPPRPEKKRKVKSDQYRARRVQKKADKKLHSQEVSRLIDCIRNPIAGSRIGKTHSHKRDEYRKVPHNKGPKAKNYTSLAGVIELRKPTVRRSLDRVERKHRKDCATYAYYFKHSKHSKSLPISDPVYRALVGIYSNEVRVPKPVRSETVSLTYDLINLKSRSAMLRWYIREGMALNRAKNYKSLQIQQRRVAHNSVSDTLLSGTNLDFSPVSERDLELLKFFVSYHDIRSQKLEIKSLIGQAFPTGVG